MSDQSKKSIVCDSCLKELIVDSSYPSNFSLELRSVDTGVNTSGVVFSVHIEPEIKETKHFCNKKCLKRWCDS